MASQTQLIGLLKKNNCYPDNQMAVILLQFYTYKINLPIKIISIFNKRIQSFEYRPFILSRQVKDIKKYKNYNNRFHFIIEFLLFVFTYIIKKTTT